MTDDDTDKTDEVRERLEEHGDDDGTTDSDSGAILTLDAESADSVAGESGDTPDDLDSSGGEGDSTGEGERGGSEDDGGQSA